MKGVVRRKHKHIGTPMIRRTPPTTLESLITDKLDSSLLSGRWRLDPSEQTVFVECDAPLEGTVVGSFSICGDTVGWVARLESAIRLGRSFNCEYSVESRDEY